MVNRDKTILAERIRERRKALGLTQQEIAGSDFTRGFISQVENGLINPSLKSLEVIAQRLGISVSYLLADETSINPTEVKALISEAAALRDAHRYQDATHVADRAIELAAAHPDPVLLAWAQRIMGWIFLDQKAYRDAATTLESSSQGYQRAGLMLDAVKVLNTAGIAWFGAGELEKAITAYQTALKFLDHFDENRDDRLRITVNLALAYEQANEYDQALPLLEQVLVWEQEGTDYYRIGDIYVSTGVIYQSLGRHDEAITAYSKAKSFFAVISKQLHYAHAAFRCGMAYFDKKDLAAAKQQVQEALDMYDKLGERANGAKARSILAHIAWHEDDLEEAYTLCTDALAHLPADHTRGRMYLLKGRILAQQGDLTDAAEAYLTGLPLLDAQTTADATDARFELGNLLLRLGRAEEASTYLIQAAASYRNMAH